MQGTYRVTFQVWPFDRQPQELCGPEIQHWDISAKDFEDACCAAEMFIAGIKRNPAVWQAPIMTRHSTKSLPHLSTGDGK